MSVESTITSTQGHYDIVFTEVYDTDADDLWSAITTPARLTRWMADYRGEFGLGRRWEALGSDGTLWCYGEVSACEPPRSFTTTWTHRGESTTTIEVRLDEVDGGTRLTLSHHGITEPSYGPGWQSYLERLARYLADRDADHRAGDWWSRRFDELEPRYAERFAELGAPGSDD